MNKMPGVAKLLGFEINETFELLLNEGWTNCAVTVDGLSIAHIGCGERGDVYLAQILAGVRSFRPIPRYTIPSDLEVDAKVWVRRHELSEWVPFHFCRIDSSNPKSPYRTWGNQNTSFTARDISITWQFCITDEEYRKRKEGE